MDPNENTVVFLDDLLQSYAGEEIVREINNVTAYLFPAEPADALSRARALLDTLTTEFDDLLARMQTPEARAGMRDAFGASADVLGRAAVAAAKRRDG
jgi:antitoxin Phd